MGPVLMSRQIQNCEDPDPVPLPDGVWHSQSREHLCDGNAMIFLPYVQGVISFRKEMFHSCWMAGVAF